MTIMDVEMSDADRHGLIPYAEELIASTQIVPTSGKKIQLLWVQIIPDPDGAEGNLVTITFNGSGVNIYKTYVLGRGAEFIGDIDQPLDILLENAVKTTVNLQYKEI